MTFSKKWALFLFVCLFVIACKSADCGCPMAEDASEKGFIDTAHLELKLRVTTPSFPPE